jgi:hypothetical protein
MKFKLMIMGVVCLVAATTVKGQAEWTKEPGYVDLDAMGTWFDEEPFLFVSVKGVLLNLVAEASSLDDPDLADLLRKLKAVQVRGYKNDGVDLKAAHGRATAFTRDLEKKGWEPAVRVRDEDERVELLMRSDGKVIAGLMIVVSNEKDETVFVNIVGDIDPSQIARLGRKFDIDELERDW